MTDTELIDNVYQGTEKFVKITKRGKFIRGALVNSLQIINSLYDVKYVATLNGHNIINEIIPRIDDPNYTFED